MNRLRALKAINGKFSESIPHWEAFHSPAYIETYLGIDPYQESVRAVQKLIRTHPIDVAVVPYSDKPIPRPILKRNADGEGHELPCWGTGFTDNWEWGKGFSSIEDVLAYDPLAERDYRDQEILSDSLNISFHDFSLPAKEMAKVFQVQINKQRELFGNTALELTGFYNTLFMWPMLTFGWENLLLLCGAYPIEMKRLLAGFAQRSRRVFEAIALTNAPLVWSHDDICCTRGPTVSPNWLREFIYPYYEEFWAIVRNSGKKLLFISDGNVTSIADDIFALGADGIMAEPYTDWRELSRKHTDKILIGEGDCRILAREDPEEIRAMVRSMAETARNCPGYFMSIGNQINHVLTPQSIRIYFKAAEEFGNRAMR